MKACFPLIEAYFSKKEMVRFLDCPYPELFRYHLGLGTWIRNHLLTVDGSLYNAFSNCGIRQKDDMSNWIIRALYIYAGIT
ncbi:DUF6794 domain-containing protein [Bengtsoniella intestinalis]|uniref:DUF6794 domain-containing protein n=1 Tax=Bengtsoniella intestinalis TaxID=3073143 RepID=UPI00391EE976